MQCLPQVAQPTPHLRATCVLAPAHTMRRGRIFVLMLAVTSLCGCAVGPNYHPRSAADLGVPDHYHLPSNESAAVPQAADTAQLADWWTSFDDPVLSSLVRKAIAGNNDLATARARLRAARAAIGIANGARLPSLSASGSATRQDTVNGSALGAGLGSGGTSFQAGFDAAWEADIFGGLSRSVEAARATAQSSAASLADVQRSLVGEVALNYIDARAAQARLNVARQNLSSQDETLQITRWREQAGLASDLDVQQAIALREQTAATIPTLEQAYASAVNHLAVLIGKAPGAVSGELATVRPIPLGPDNVETGLPADLLNRRPDVIAAERTLAAQVAQIGVAEADLYPALRLSGSLTSTSVTTRTFGDSILSGLVGAITAPIFEGGQIRARIRQQQATADAALATYRTTVLSALEDVANALEAIDRSKAREAALARSAAAASQSTQLAEARYRSGLTDFQTLLDAQRSLLSAQDSLASARADRATASVQLFKALGGGWQPEQAETK